MWYDDDDDDDDKKTNDEEPIVEAGDYDLGDDIGTLIGEGHDSEAEPV
ncbi:hypothetical protein KKF55_05095 [Patescibacteria group bacterium]|nr:hypothetical protein [Patescibacteria group bacterium]